jgi:AcrR family transcriptional regulator
MENSIDRRKVLDRDQGQIGRKETRLARSKKAAKPHAEATSARTRILQAATKLFTENPFDDISAADIAKSAGVAHGLTFHYFGSKAKLYEEVSRLAANSMHQIHVSAMHDGDAADKLRLFLTSHMDEVWRRRADYVFHSRGGGTPAIQEIWEESRRNAILLILASFGIKEPSANLIIALRAWLGFFDELVLAWVQGRLKNRQAIVGMTLRQFPGVMDNASMLGAKDVPRLSKDFLKKVSAS